MTQPYAFINERIQGYSMLKSSLSLGRNAATKFDTLNAHIHNMMVLPGQIVIVGDDSTMSCTAEEARLMEAGWRVRHALASNLARSDGFILENYDLLQMLLGNAALGLGSASNAWNKHLTAVSSTLQEIEALHKHSLSRSGGRDEFLAQRRLLFAKLDAQLEGFARYGTGLRNRGSIKKMLGISTRSYVQSGEIKSYASTLDSISRTANHLKKGTPIGIALDTTATALEIREACSSGREEQCREAKFVESGKLAGNVAGGLIAGPASVWVCVTILGITTGPGALSCLVVSGVAGGAMFGGLVGGAGERTGEKLYQWTAP
ncbi:SSU ribosomal protein S2p (SAe) [Pseudomonas agarici]|uniref:SSU ribosomal protein S2p (SAe) n=1 Tax=Pseudomonas agarici TaxID=46677 RepID=A0A0X1T632_PSEAA|nr:hypothetical protein [Pseudomonas agarici]AMB87442.1 SSU ribosomal protein S2p (SAe) [Pseudomonas agarici]NWB90879.1 hypothetical protein [Pseudomonas agarici]NWC11833.1 hypothetical protein [Pseudomonas agarici]SEL78496.1 hypothetical protein SAMN05216604_13344 [Pseudomonas agarici]